MKAYYPRKGALIMSSDTFWQMRPALIDSKGKRFPGTLIDVETEAPDVIVTFQYLSDLVAFYELWQETKR